MIEEDAVAEVIRREKALLDPALRASRESVAALLHPGFVEFGACGRVWDRDSTIAALGDDPAVSGSSSDFRAEVLADDVVLLTYRITGERGTVRSSVWVHESDYGWRLRFHQGTPSDAPARGEPPA